MTAVELLFGTVLVVAVPLTLRRVRLDDPAADRLVRAVLPGAIPSTAALAGGMALAPGPLAVVLAVPWLATTVSLAAGALIAVVRRGRDHAVRRLATAIALGFLAFGAANATSFAAGFGPLGFAPMIILLTAVHFHTAGFVLTTAGMVTFDRAPTLVAAIGIGGVAGGSVVTAAGFVGVPGAASVGAVTVAIGALLLGVATLRARGRMRSGWARRLTSLAASALLVSMPLAIGWALAPLFAVAIPLDAMIRTHGAINALLVAVPFAIGWELDARSGDR
jgi:hypothetical protein